MQTGYFAMNYRAFSYLGCLVVVCLAWSVIAGPYREGVNPRFTTISSRTVIPDQSELDQVDEEALKRGHEEITVDKDDEILTEVIEDDAPPSSLPLTIKSKPTVVPSMSVSNATKHRNLTNKELQNTQPTINKDKSGYFFSKSKNKSPNTTLTLGEQGQNVAENSTGNTNFLHQSNSLQTAQIIGDSSSTSQRSTNFSLPSISGETNKIDSIGQKFKNSSQNTSSFHDESATSQVQLSEFNTTKANATNNSLSQGSSNLMPSTSTQNSYTEIHNESSSFGNKPVGKTAIKDNVSNLTDLQNIETIKSNDNSKSDNTLSADLTETVNATSNNIFLKGVENISKTKKSIGNNSTDVTSIIVPEQRQNRVKESNLKKSIAGRTVSTTTSDIGRASVFNTNGTKTLVSTSNVTSERDNSLPVLGISETKKIAVDRLDQKMDVLLRSHRDRTKEPQGQLEMKNVSLHADNGSRSFLPTNVRRMNIIHHHASTSAPRKQNKASRKLKSFLTAVKQMFKEPETAQDILAWEAWGPCSRTCGEGAVRIRQRKCAQLVARDFDVACPEPREQRQKCPVVSCLSKHDKKSSQQFAKTTESQNNVPHRPVADYKNIDEASGKQTDSLRAQASSVVNKFIGTDNNLNQDSDDVSTTSRLNTEDQTDDDALIPTEDSEGTTEGYDGSSVQEYQSNLASVQTANQKRYLYTVWGTWSACTRTCGQRAHAFRKRYCINAVTGEIKRHCQKPTILAKKCVLTSCPVDGGLSDWSKWSSCSDSCGIMERHRSCTNPKPAFGGRECFKLPVQMRLCGTCTEDKVVAVQKLPSYSPKVLCGFDPCQHVGCLEDKGAICVTDFECNPTFFDDEGNVLKGCRDSTQLFLRPLAQNKCSFNPCSFTKCDAHGAKCLVDTKCRPFFVNEMGKRVNCKGSNVLQISSELICGFNPCKITTCTVDPEAKCVTDYRCNPIFINAAGQRISGCTEDEVEEAERLSTERPTAARQSTENPSARDVTPFQHHNPYRPHSSQKYREESSVKKSIESNLHETKEKLKDIKLLEDIFTRRLHHDENLDSENETYSGNLEIGHPDESGHHLNTSSENLGKETRKASSIKLLEHILQNHLHPSKSLDSTNSILSEQSEKFQDKTEDKSEKSSIKLLEHILQNHLHPSKSLDSTNSILSKQSEKSRDKTEGKSENRGIKLLEHILQVHLHRSKSLDFTNSTLSEQSEKSRDKTKGKSENSGIKLLEHILQVHLHRSKSLDSKKSMLSGKSEKSQDKTGGKSEKDFQNFRHDNDSGNGSKALLENRNKKSANKITGFNLLNSDNGITSDDRIKLKTLHQNKDETTDIVDSPSFASNSLDSPKSHEISKINQVLDKPLEFTNKNSVDPSEKLFQSKTLTDKIMETDSNAKISLTTQGKSESKSLEKEQRKNLADVDRFILDQLYKKKKMEYSGTTSLGLSGANHAQGKVTSNAVGVKGYMGENNVNSEVKNEGNSSGYNNDNNNNNWNNGNNDSNSNNDTSNGSGNNKNISSLNDNNNNNNNNNLNSSAVSNQAFNNGTLLNTQENILKNSPTSISGTMVKMKGTNEIINNHLTTTTTTSTANNNNSNNNSNNNNNGNSNVISDNYNNNNNHINLNPDYNKNVLNTKINLKPSKTPPTIISTTPKSNLPPQNNTIHYNLGLTKIASTRNENENKLPDSKLRIHSRPQMPKASSDKKLGDTKNDNIKGKVMPWEEYIANMKNMNEGSVLFDDAKEVTHGKPQFDHNQSDNYDSSVVDVKLKSGKIKLVDGSKMVPGHDAVGAETRKPGIGGQVIHSSDPRLEIPPYDEEVASSAFEKEQSENPEGIPSTAELNRILNSVSDSQLASGNQEPNTLLGNSQDRHADYVLPKKSRHEHKYLLASSARPLLSGAQQVHRVTNKPVNQVTNKPVNRVTNKPVNQVTNKPVNPVTDLPVNQVTNKPVNQVVNKPVNQVTDIPVNQVTDVPVNQVTNKPVNQVTDSPSQNDLINKLVLKAVQRELAKLKLDGLLKDSLKNTKPKAHQGSDETAKIFTQKPNSGYLGITRKPSDNHAYLGLSKGYHGLDLKVHGQPGGKELFSTPKPFHFNAISTNVPIFQDEKGSHSYNEQASGTDSQQGGVGSGQQGSEPDKSNELENDAESLREIDEILKSPYTGNEIEKTTARPGQTTITPEENNNHKIVESPNDYTVTLAPMKEGGTENDEEDQRISEVNDEDREEQKEPAYKESYSPALMDEIKELGLHEYYIKDGFQTPRVPKHRKVADGQVRQVLKSHHWEGDSDDYDRHKNHPVRYKKKFHLAQVEMLPETYAGHSVLRQHNADGDEIERVPNNYREADGVARSHTSQHGVGSLTKYLEHLRQYVSGMDGDLLDSSLKGKHRNEATQGDLGNAIILNAKDDGNSENGIDDSENSIEDSKTPRNRNRISQKDVLFAEDSESGKNGVMVFKVSDDDANYRRTLGLRSRHPRLKTYSKQRQSMT